MAVRVRWYFYFVMLCAIVLTVIGCADDKSSKTGTAVNIDVTRLVPSNFSGGDIPQIDVPAGFPGPTSALVWNDPCVMKSGTQYWMYASAVPGDNVPDSEGSSFHYPLRLYRLVSADGIHWTQNPSTPVFGPDVSGSWDGGSVETPAVVFFNGKYHLFYTAYPYANPQNTNNTFVSGATFFKWGIGHAISNDGITFVRASQSKIIAPSGPDSDPSNDWYAFNVAEPGPVVHNNKIYLYFTALGADAELNNSLQVIGLMTSSDGENWDSPVRVLKPDQKQYPRSNNWVGYSTPNAIELSDGIHLFYDVAITDPDGTNWRQVRLHHARSADGITGWIQDAAPIRKAG
ncbi:MAG TPA: hypothetical protein VF857_11520, partial [Spirochaetota bacterium]